MADVKEFLSGAEERMEEAVMYLEDSLARIRAGKANIKLLDGIRVDNYGSMVPINNCAAVTTPDARTIAIKPWDKSMFKVIEKAIINSDLGIMPENNGETSASAYRPSPRSAVSNWSSSAARRPRMPR